MTNELRQRDNTIKEVLERLKKTIDTAPISYMMIVKGLVEEINFAMSRDTGLKVGDNVLSLFASEGQRIRLLEKLKTERQITNEIMALNMADGEFHRCLLNVTVVDYKKEEAVIVWGLDFEKDEKQKDQLKLAQKSLQMLLDLLPVSVRIVDIESETIIYVNNAFLEMFKYSRSDDICGRKLIEIVPAFQNDGVAADHKVRLAVSTSEPIEIEVDYSIADGSRIEALLVSRYIEYKGKPCSIGIIRDMSKERRESELRRAAMAAEAASRAKSAFIANMSHEIRTPMNSIVGFAELALANNIPPETRGFLHKIRESSNILLRIINDILDISKIESGKIELETIPFDLHEVFRACQTIVAPRAMEKGITLYCYAEPSVGRKLLGDPTKLRQALLNLLSNAVKFTNIGTVKLLSDIVGQTGQTVTVRFEVKDSGIGMSPEQIKKVFDPFVQADESTTRKYGGTGLGLPITKNIVELMGGELSVESTVGVGSIFSFTLVFKTINENEAPREDIPDISEKPVFRGEVLICEDNTMNRQVICEHLKRVGLTSVVAVNGQEGAEMVHRRMKRNEKPFDLIFMDIHMPVMDGMEAARYLNEIGSTTPVIALTANAMTTDRKSYKELGMCDYLAKPFRMQELWACLLRHLTPLNNSEISIPAADEREMSEQLKVIFTQDWKNAESELEAALESGDIKTAVRIAHSLKSVSGIVGKHVLREYAAGVENSLKNTGKADIAALEVLFAELNTVLSEFEPAAREYEQKQKRPADTLPMPEALELLTNLEELLTVGDAESLSFVDKLWSIPYTEDLIYHIERYDFPKAHEALIAVRHKIVNEKGRSKHE